MTFVKLNGDISMTHENRVTTRRWMFLSNGQAVAAWLAAVLVCCVFNLAAPGQTIQDAFANTRGRTKFPIELSHGEVIVAVSIRGSGPLRFVLDSGSTRTLIDRKVAAELGLKEGEESSLQGAGQGRIPIHALHISLAMPGLDSKGYDCFTVDLNPVNQAVGTRQDGILGYDFLARFVITLDFEGKQMRVELPAAFRPPSGFEALPIDIRNKWPFVKGELVMPGPVTVQDSFFIDSGSSDAVDHPVVKTLKEKTASKSGVGFGTPVEGFSAVATSFRIGSFHVAAPIVACCGATEATSRMIGTEILRRFTVVFDYPSSRVFLRPNKAFHEQSSL